MLMTRNARSVSEDELAELPCPQGTRTWMPIPHTWLLHLVRRSIPLPWEIVSQEHTVVGKDGHSYFGLLHLRQESLADYYFTIGLRNNHRKQFAAGLAFGHKVLVCENLAFIGERVLTRKHTTGIVADLPSRVRQVVTEALPDFHTRQCDFFHQLHTSHLTVADTYWLVHQSIMRGIIPKQHAYLPMKQLEEMGLLPARNERYFISAWNVYQGFTRVMRLVCPPTRIVRRTVKLYNLFQELWRNPV